jgi:signal transduction histidine kinase
LESTNKVGTLILIGTGLIVILVFVVLFLAVFYQSYVLKMKRNEAELLLKTSLDSENQERKRIAADIHDGISGDLNAIRNFLTVLHKSEKDNEKKLLFEDIKLGVEAAIENTRLVSYRLMPPLLESSGFLVAIEDYFERLNSKTKARFVLSTKLDTFELPHEISYELFRVIQEFTTNMIKYGGITKCEVVVSNNDNLYHLTLLDDGKPFDFKEMYSLSKGTGLKNINSRLKVINASLIQKPISEGNQFEISIKNSIK